MTRHKRSPRQPPTATAAVADNTRERLRRWLLGGMTALIVARPLFPSESVAMHGDGLTVVMLWMALAVFWLLGAVGRPSFSMRFGWIDVAVLFVVGWHTLAALTAVAYGSPRPAVNMLWEWIGLGLCFLLARQLVATQREARAIAAVMIALAVALACYGLYQYAVEMPQTRAEYESDPDGAMRRAGLWFPPDSPERKRFADRLYSTEPIATFALTNSLAGFLVPWFVVLTGVAVGSVHNRKRLAGAVLCMIPIVACLLLTKSRSGYLAAGLGLLIAGWVSRPATMRFRWKPLGAVFLCLMLLIVALIAAGGLDREIIGQASKSLGYRLEYWRSTLRMIGEHPWFGCGPGNFQYEYTRYKLPQASEEIADPHNFLLEIWATAGTPAVLAFLAVLGCFVWVMRCPQLQPPNPSSDGWISILAGAAGGFLLSLPLGMLGAAPPGMAAVLVGLPVAILTTILLLGWIRNGQLPRLLPGVAIVALLINLLAAGGIGFPGVAGSLWLLLAVGLAGDCLPSVDARAEQPARVAWMLLAVLIVAAVACYASAYSPVLCCQAQLRLAERNPTRAAEYLEAAALADPLSAEPWRQLAALRFELWRWQPTVDSYNRFQAAEANLLRLAPNSASDWAVAGQRAVQAAEMTDDAGKPLLPEANQIALDRYNQAVRLYPNNPLHRAELAGAYLAGGDRKSFCREAAIALELDQATPHSDRKLSPEVRQRLARELDECK